MDEERKINQLTDEEIRDFLFSCSDECVHVADIISIEKPSYDDCIECLIAAEVWDAQNLEVVEGVQGGFYTVRKYVTLRDYGLRWPFKVHESEKKVMWLRFLGEKNMLSADTAIEVDAFDLNEAFAGLFFAKELAAVVPSALDGDVKSARYARVLASRLSRVCKVFAEENRIAKLFRPPMASLAEIISASECKGETH